MGASTVKDEIYSYPSFETHKNIRVHLEGIEKFLERIPYRTSPPPCVGSLKTEKEICYDILEITMAIEKLYPELSKYLGEMPAEVSYTDLTISRDSLARYFDSLDTLLRRYAYYHP